MTTNQTTTHQAPPAGQTRTPCCGQTIFDLLRTDRLTNNPDTITCHQAAAEDLSSVSPAADPSTRLTGIYGEIRAERDRAHAKHGATSMESAPIDEMYRAVILGEEIGEVAELAWSTALVAKFSYVQKAMNDGRYDGVVDQRKLRRELVQVAAMAAAWADRIPVAGGGPSRPWTPDEETAGGGKRITAKRACNGCGRLLGDVSEAEMDAVLAGAGLPDVRVECGCVDGDYRPVAAETAAAAAGGPVTPAGACSGGCVSVERLTGALRALEKAGPWACMAIPPTLRRLAELLEAGAGGA